MQNEMIKFPKGFLWGTATSSYQNEGNNVNSDWWAMEYSSETKIKDHSGSACDFYHLYKDDIKMVALLGFNSFRFSLAWERIEPEENIFSGAELKHYEDIIDTCWKYHLEPIVTLCHFSLPRWIGERGGMYWDGLPDAFARYCNKVLETFGDKIKWISSFNEPDLYTNFGCRSARFPTGSWAEKRQMDLDMVADVVMEHFVEAHHLGRKVVKEFNPEIQYGWNLAVPEFGCREGCEKEFEIFKKRWEDECFKAAAEDDYLGIQTYTRWYFGRTDMESERNDEKLPSFITCYPKGTRLTEWGVEFYPSALGHSIRYAYEKTRVPILVSENGIATTNDDERIEYLGLAIRGMGECVQDGIPVVGYCHWTLMDNWEWENGYTCHFGLVECDCNTFERRLKRSATWLGNVAHDNAII